MAGFELSAARKVRREELYASRSPSPSESDPELQAALQRQLESVYGSAFEGVGYEEVIPAETDANIDAEVKDADADEGFEFRLFAAPIKTSSTEPNSELPKMVAPRIILEEDEDGAAGDGAFITERPPSYYFAEKTAEQKRQFELSAITGDDVRKWLGVKYKAWEKPWKLQVLKPFSKMAMQENKAHAGPGVLELERVGELQAKKKQKPGKKRRIILRQRKKKSEESKAKREHLAKEKEEAEKEKRTRRNREKKVKKKAKEKAKKAEAKNVDTGAEISQVGAGE